jgi:hypothetical protein
MKMFDKIVVHEALKRCLVPDSGSRFVHHKLIAGQDSQISLMIHDIFGGEILKTHSHKKWHFYNRIDGVRIDFTGSVPQKAVGTNGFEDIPSTPAETYSYFDNTDYSTFLMRFVRIFEETIGLEKYRTALIA